METYAVLIVTLLPFVLWLYTTFIVRSFPTLTGKRIVLVIAHPDDEAMFFAPTVQALTRPELGNHLKILCLSTGNADGLGEIRQKEMLKSGSILGIPDKKNDIIILDDPQLQDGPDQWDAKYIGRTLLKVFAPEVHQGKASNSKPLSAGIDAIITFDEGGVSTHPNHISCYHGVMHFFSELMRGRRGWESPVGVYTLTSLNIFRKYLHMFDAVPTILVAMYQILRYGREPRTRTRNRDGRSNQSRVNDTYPTPLLFVNGILGWFNAQKAMVSGHWSQMIWFRWGWIGLGRYLLINDLKKVRGS